MTIGHELPSIVLFLRLSYIQLRKVSAMSCEAKVPGAHFITRTLQLRFGEFNTTIIYVIHVA